MYHIQQITRLEDWESFVQTQEYTLMTQSPKYGEFYQQMQEDFWIFGIYQDDKLIGGSLVLGTHAKRGNFLFLPYGPLLGPNESEALTVFISFIKKFAQDKKYDFVRLSPFLEDSPGRRKMFQSLGLKKAPLHALAETTWLLDLTLDENTLLKNMNKNHRNLIRRCEREGVIIKTSADSSTLADFNELHDITARRHHFTRFSDEYIAQEFAVFTKDREVLNLKAFLPTGELDASSIVYFYGNMAAYRHGASLGLNHKLPTSYLLQWTAIKEAKCRGLKWYNFWGIAPSGANKKHPFYGITHFKKGFGGKQLDLLPCHDLPISKKYWFNWGVETLRRIKRGF